MSVNAKKKVLLIGAGPTSSLISYLIANNKTLKDAVEIHVWEKAKDLGGRFSTFRSSKNPDCYADLGAQYLTLSRTHPSSTEYFENLEKYNLIRQLETNGIPGFRPDPTKAHYASLHGMASIVRHFFEKGSVCNSIKFNHNVTKVCILPGNRVEVETAEKLTNVFDIAISTMPVPQLLQLKDLAKDLDVEVKRNLEAVKYSSRFAIGLYFDTPIKLESSKCPLNFVNDTMIRYWSIENLKRKGDFQEPTSLVIHTSIDYGRKNIDKDSESIKQQILRKAVDLIPEVSKVPNESVQTHIWEYSQVLEPYNGQPGCILLLKHFIAAGDGFSVSGFEGYVDSAEKTVRLLQKELNL